MNHYDFEQISDRKETEAAKWMQISKEKRSELMPFTVADLEYTLPNEIASPLQDYIASLCLVMNWPVHHTTKR